MSASGYKIAPNMAAHPTPKQANEYISSPEYIERSNRRILFFRILVSLCLVAAAGVCSGFGYTITYHLENRVFNIQYDSIADQLQASISKDIQTRATGAETLANTLSIYCPDADKWPNCSIPIRQYASLTNSLSKISKATTFAFTPLVRREKLRGFEAYAKNFYTNDPSLPPNFGQTPLGTVVWYYNSTFTRQIDGSTSWGGLHYAAPLFEMSDINTYRILMLIDLHYYYFYGIPMDSILACHEANNSASCPPEIAGLSLTSINNGAEELDPQSAITQPIYASNPPVLVGFIIVLHRWINIFDASNIPDFVSMDIILSDGNIDVSFSLKGSTLKVNGKGDMHDSKYNSYAKTFDVTGNIGFSAHYYVTFYPTDDFYQSYHSNIPLIVCIGALGIIMLTSAIFFFYDWFVKREALEKQMILDSKRIFVRFISHEIRTPMNTVCLGLQLMKDELDVITALPELEQSPKCATMLRDYSSLIQEVRESSDTAVLVLNDLINYDKIEMRTLTIERKPLPVWLMINKTVKPLMVQAKQSDITLISELEIDQVTLSSQHIFRLNGLVIIGDSIKLGQVIRNVVSNALKFSPVGTTVVVTAKWNPDGLPDFLIDNYELTMYEPCGSLIISVKDEGPGLSKENIESLFQEGKQFNPNELQAGQGSGLGLWISHGIVEQHQGKISATSPGLGLGAVFTIELPVCEHRNYMQNEPKRDQNQQADEELAPPPSIGQSVVVPKEKPVEKLAGVKRILIVDDAPSNRKILCRMLRGEGFTCQEAEDGAQCVKIFTEASTTPEAFDLILMDFEMPVMNGPSAIKKLRELGFKTICIGVTGNVLPADVQFFIDHGVNAVLHKPLTVSMVFSAHAEILRVFSEASSMDNVADKV